MNACVFSAIDAFSGDFGEVALFHPLDDAPVLTDQLVQLARDPTLREEYRTKGSRLIETDYSIDHVVDRYCDLHEAVLSERDT
jgi:hypothetical protein